MHSHHVCVVAASLVIGLATVASAQDIPRTEISGGPQWMRNGGETSFTGWWGDVAVTISRTFAVVGHIDGDSNDTDGTFSNAGFTVTVQGHSLIVNGLGGLRVSLRPSPRVVPYAQALFGATHVSATATTTFPGLPQPITTSISGTEPVIHVGGGVTLVVGRGLGFNVSLDHRRVFVADISDGALRLATGIILRF